MSAIRGFRTAPIRRAEGETASAALTEISKLAQRSVEPSEVYVRSAWLCNDQTDRYMTRFTKRALDTIAEEIGGLPVMRNHNTWGSADLPVARWLFGERGKYEMTNLDGKRVTADGVLATFFAAKAADVHGLIPNMDLGVISEVSFSWYSGPFLCSVCGKALSDPECKHRVGSEYDGEVCVGLMDDIQEGVEASLVWKGGQVGTKIIEPRFANASEAEAVSVELAMRSYREKNASAGRGREVGADVLPWLN